MSLWTATCHSQVATQRQRDLELVDASSCVLRQSKQMPILLESSETRLNQMRNWEVGSGCHKRFYIGPFSSDVFIDYLLKLAAPPRAALLVRKRFCSFLFLESFNFNSSEEITRQGHERN